MSDEKAEDKSQPGEAARKLICSCAQDPFASLPSDLKPRQESWKKQLRHVTCPGCGMLFWTNRQDDFCGTCRARDVK